MANTNRSESQDAAFPITDLTEALPQLRRPFTPAAIRLKPQVVKDDKGLVTFYVDARLVAERLNTVVGAGAWSDSYRLLVDGAVAPGLGIPVECTLTVLGVSKTDVGQLAPGAVDDKAWKSAYSDALKRAAVKFGVGAFLYNGPQVWAEVKIGRSGKAQGFSPAGVSGARNAYVKWLKDVGGVLYGEPLDHGDVEREYVEPEEAETQPATRAGGGGGAGTNPSQPRSWGGVNKMVEPFGEEVAAAWNAFVGQACEHLFERDTASMEASQAAVLLEKASRASVRFVDLIQAAAQPPVWEDVVGALQAAFASVLDGALLPGPTWTPETAAEEFATDEKLGEPQEAASGRARERVADGDGSDEGSGSPGRETAAEAPVAS